MTQNVQYNNKNHFIIFLIIFNNNNFKNVDIL